MPAMRMRVSVNARSDRRRSASLDAVMSTSVRSTEKHAQLGGHLVQHVVGRAASRLGVASLPVETAQLVGQHHAYDLGRSDELHLKWIALHLAGDRAAQHEAARDVVGKCCLPHYFPAVQSRNFVM